MRISPWEVIANYEAFDIVRERYHAKHGRIPNTSHVREIAAPFIQARHYFSAAQSSDRTIKPLLLYYGVASLSRGLVLFLGRNVRTATLAPGHGLSITGWRETLAADKPDIGNLSVMSNKSGAFIELIQATENRSLLRSNNSAVNYKTTEEFIPNGSKFYLGELLTSLPELIDTVKQWRTPRCIRFEAKEISEGREFNVIIPRTDYPYITDSLVKNIIGDENCEILSQNEKFIELATNNNRNVNAVISDFADEVAFGIGSLYLCGRSESGFGLNKISHLFAVSYVLGMLVRYYPTFWMDFMHQRINDVSLPTILKSIKCIEELYPKIVVDFLEEREISR